MEPYLLELPFPSTSDIVDSPCFTEVVNICTCWNVGVWGRAFQTALEKIGHERLRNATILEIGASDYSSLAVAFSYLGAKSSASYFFSSPEPLIHKLASKYDITQSIPVRRIDIQDPYEGEKFNIVVAKSVLGTPSFSGNDQSLKEVVQNLRSMVAPGGILLTLDNAVGIWPQHWLRNKFGTGREGWRYFTSDDYQTLVLSGNSEFLSFGLTSFVELGAPRLQRYLSAFDRNFDWLVPRGLRPVFVGISRVP